MGRFFLVGILALCGLASNAGAQVAAGDAAWNQGRYAEALAFIGRAKTRDDIAEPYTLRLWYVKGDILDRAGRPREAAVEFRKVVRHDQSAFDAAERLANLS